MDKAPTRRGQEKRREGSPETGILDAFGDRPQRDPPEIALSSQTANCLKPSSSRGAVNEGHVPRAPSLIGIMPGWPNPGQLALCIY
ncbi:hypothetical protein ColLi_07897 [Colletotrichum liriopes]|uniref:Uncharacterized protein n=1 Tax=Colletotrichum liriopes TaxID=708192 RepID=A0AA37LUA4_9PEZI|nr:hypothetical protein ColLi_07897 [Colletotrichum liriopes]